MRDLRSLFARPIRVAMPVAFFLISLLLFPLAVGPDQNLLRTIAPGVVWVLTLFSSLLALDSVFSSDADDGTLQQLLLNSHSLTLVVCAKAIVHWLVTGLPITLLLPIVGLQYDLPQNITNAIAISMLVGTPTLSLIGVAGAALTLGARGSAALLMIVMLPFFVPVLILGTSAASYGVDEIMGFHFPLLTALLLFSMVVSPAIGAAALRTSIE
ncbi:MULTISPECIES: heme exporter protein CcmB [unclassified Janthinobacterium]|uniref:heme exporter protein CcmB n=1 Tax=unclassified Janthinobacterium TaxID=2610881 RepID=UPI00267656A3|nr:MULTISPECIES: heme exporter protein CcmB [unclassified Janthinobacterium]